MAKKFLGSVGTAEAFRRTKNGELQLAFRSKTLTDSGINISTTKDEIRGGTGAPVQLVFCHDTTAQITLTDILFDEAYVQAQLGTSFEHGGEVYESETIKAKQNGVLELKYEAEELPITCSMGTKIYAWVTNKGEDNWTVAPVDGKLIKSDKIEKDTEYCVRYLRYNDNAHIADVLSDFIPEELLLVITAPIFAGDACSASNGKKAGTITYEIPRYKLDGSLDIANNMSSNTTMSLSGTAFASDNTGCDVNGSRLVRIISVEEGLLWQEEAVDAEPYGDPYFGEEVDIRAIFKDGQVGNKGIKIDDLCYAKTTNEESGEEFELLSTHPNIELSGNTYVYKRVGDQTEALFTGLRFVKDISVDKKITAYDTVISDFKVTGKEE